MVLKLSIILYSLHRLMNQTSEITSEYRSLISKLEELLRYYKISKRNNKNNILQERVKNKVAEIVNKLLVFPSFKEIQSECTKKIENAFKEEVKKQTLNNAKLSKQSELSHKSRFIEPKKSFVGSNFSSGSSDFSSQSSNSSKKQVVQEKSINLTPLEKPKVNPPKLIKEQVKPQIIKTEVIIPKVQLPKSILQTPKPLQIVPQVKQKIEVKQSNSDKVIESLNNSSSSLKEGNKQDSSISSIQNLKINNQKSNKSQESNGSQGSLLSFLEQSQSLKDYHFLLHKPNSNGKQQLRKEDDSQKYSESSVTQNTIDTIVKFCCDNKDKLNSQLQFNQDIFDQIRDEEGNFVYLYGVNKPQGHKNQKLYVCTLMKFSAQEVFKCDQLFQKENKDFKNNIRIPIGIIIKGDTTAAIQPEHIKFLINLQCPFMTILILKDYQQYNGILCHFHESILRRIRITPRKQLGQCAQQLLKKTYSLPFNQSFLPKEKTRYVITKSLNRTIMTPVQEAPNAIHISDNQCIRQQKNSFNYKVHTKFIGTKLEYSIYFVNNGIVNLRRDFKDFQHYKKQVLCLEPKIPIILSLCVLRDVNPIKKQFLDLALQTNKIRDPMIFLHFSGLKDKKTVIITLKSDVTSQMIEKMGPMSIKNFEKDNHLTYCVLVLTKNNLKEYQDAKSELTEIKLK